MDRPAPHQLSPALDRRRDDAVAIAAAGVAAVTPRAVMRRIAAELVTSTSVRAVPRYVVAVGKAAAGMFTEFAAAAPGFRGEALVVGPHRPDDWPQSIPFIEAGHPVATPFSVRAAERALAVAAAVPADGTLICLLSGGASALLAAPVDGLSLEDKQRTVTQVMHGGADISALNAVRKHLSRVKGGRLAAACRGTTVTYALSDVIGDDLSVIGSGPAVADWSTWHDAKAAIDRFADWQTVPAAVRGVIEAGLRGQRADTPKAGDPALARTTARVIGGRREAMEGARLAAETRGYTTLVLEAPVCGEARPAALAWAQVAAEATAQAGRPMAVISSGETTVRVTGGGRGGRNQEFALALVDLVARRHDAVVVLSMGTDGIDGPTTAAGAVVDVTTKDRALAIGLDLPRLLADNDSHRGLAALGDLVVTGPTGTNVGDLQVWLSGPD